MKNQIKLTLIKFLTAGTLITALLLTLALVSGFAFSGTEFAGPVPGGTGS